MIHPDMPRQPKLRSSCDGCGAAKLKCDRGQPACGRCRSLQLDCVYGVSQKTGKPPRERIRLAQTADTPHILGQHSNGGDDARNRENINRDAGFGSSDILQDPSHIFAGTSVNPPDATHNDLFRPLLPSFTNFDFDDIFFSDMDTGLTPPDSEAYNTLITQTDAPKPHAQKSSRFDKAFLQSEDKEGHTCFREAYAILGSLFLHQSINAPSISESPRPGSAQTTISTNNQVPLDHVLQLNREASEQLGRLLSCSCAKCPQLTMVLASIISQVLLWYQQAATCTESPHAHIDIDKSPVSHGMSLSGPSPDSDPGNVGGSSLWLNTAAGTSNMGGANGYTSTHSTGSVAPAKITVGNFNIDDLRIQAALKIQLLLGEMRRAGNLIDQLALHKFDGQGMNDEYVSGGVNSLYPSIEAWLRSEHSRIANMMKAKLRDLNI